MDVDVRDAFFDEIYELAKNDSRLMVLSNDQSAFSLNKLTKDFPEQYINIGIAEQNIINVATGLALGGIKPIVYGITNFISMRCCEQIHVDLGCMNLPVMIVASGGGLTYASDGPTHHATQDIAMLRTVPNLTIFNPGDATLTSYSARAGFALNSPCYVRLEKGVLPDLHSPQDDFSRGYRMVQEGKGILLAGTGHMMHRVTQVAEKLKKNSVDAAVLDVFRLKPVDEDGLAQVISRRKEIVVIEEQYPTGGLGTIFAEIITRRRLDVKFKTFSLPDAPCYRYGSREWLHREFGLDTETLASSIKEWL